MNRITPEKYTSETSPEFHPKPLPLEHLSSLVKSSAGILEKQLQSKTPMKPNIWAIFTGALGSIWNSWAGKKHIETNLQREFKQEKVFDDKNKLITSKTISEILNDPNLWKELSTHRGLYLSLLKNQQYHPKIESMLKHLLQEPSTVTPQSKEHILKTLASITGARDTLSQIAQEASPSLAVLLKNSASIKKLLSEQGIEPAKQNTMIDAMAPALSTFFLHSNTFVWLADRINQGPINETTLLNIAPYLKALITIPTLTPLLEPKILEPVLKALLEKRWKKNDSDTTQKIAQSLAKLIHTTSKLDKQSFDAIDHILQPVGGSLKLASKALRQSGLDTLVSALADGLKKIGEAPAGELTRKVEHEFTEALTKEGLKISDSALKSLSLILRKTVLEGTSQLLKDPISKAALAEVLTAVSDSDLKKVPLNLIQSEKMGQVLMILGNEIKRLPEDQKPALHEFMTYLIIHGLTKQSVVTLSESEKKALRPMVDIIFSVLGALSENIENAEKINSILKIFPQGGELKKDLQTFNQFRIELFKLIQPLDANIKEKVQQSLNEVAQILRERATEVPKPLQEMIQKKLKPETPVEISILLAKTSLGGLAVSMTDLQTIETISEAFEAYQAYTREPSKAGELELKQAIEKLIKTGKLAEIVQIFAANIQKLPENQQVTVRYFLDRLLLQTLKERFGFNQIALHKFVSSLSKSFIKAASRVDSTKNIQAVLNLLTESFNVAQLPKFQAALQALNPDKTTLGAAIDTFLLETAKASHVSFSERNAQEVSSFLLDPEKIKETIELKEYCDSQSHWRISKFFKKAMFAYKNFSISTLLNLRKLKNKLS